MDEGTKVLVEVGGVGIIIGLSTLFHYLIHIRRSYRKQIQQSLNHAKLRLRRLTKISHGDGPFPNRRKEEWYERIYVYRKVYVEDKHGNGHDAWCELQLGVLFGVKRVLWKPRLNQLNKLIQQKGEQ